MNKHSRCYTDTCIYIWTSCQTSNLIWGGGGSTSSYLRRRGVKNTLEPSLRGESWHQYQFWDNDPNNALPFPGLCFSWPSIRSGIKYPQIDLAEHGLASQFTFLGSYPNLSVLKLHFLKGRVTFSSSTTVWIKEVRSYHQSFVLHVWLWEAKRKCMVVFVSNKKSSALDQLCPSLAVTRTGHL